MTEEYGETGSRLPVEHRLVRLIGILAGLVGLFLLLVGVGTAVDYLVAQSHAVGIVAAFALRMGYTVSGVVLVLLGFGAVRWSTGR